MPKRVVLDEGEAWRLLCAGFTLIEAAKRLGVSDEVVTKRMQKLHGIEEYKKVVGRKREPIPRGTVTGAMVKEGWKRREIAEAYGKGNVSSTQHLLERVPEYQDRKRQRAEEWQAILALHRQGATATEIANIYGKNVAGLRAKFHLHGMKLNDARHLGNPRHPFDEDEAWRLLHQGLSIRQVAKQIGIAASTLLRRMRKLHYGSNR